MKVKADTFKIEVKADEFKTKVKKLREILETVQSDGILIKKQSNFSWLTGGRGFIGLASENACGAILVTGERVYLIANNIEVPRLIEEETALETGIETRVIPWYEDNRMDALVGELAGGGKIVADDSIASYMVGLRTTLCREEQERYRWLGRHSAAALEAVCRELGQGESEFQIAARVSARLWEQGIEPITVLAAADDRVFKYRHLIPTDKELKNYCLISICARKWGLVASATRLVHFGAVPDEIGEKLKKVAAIDAAFISMTRPGAVAGDIFSKAQKLYHTYGYPGEWELHHQGGLTGYMAREYRVVPGSDYAVQAGQAFAWNPTITGVKSEDTVLVLEDRNEVITHTGGYTYIEAEYEGQKCLRPGILIR